ncbi:hypothetical protein [Sulfuritalea sp.]|uniref:hypothetical protein n=1 Tax=Sulfuritalea sp. TaxID=2480090 RepID=UPI0025DD6592|nr:hypothetical protein [Sulfuritalea sp.]
MFSLVALVSIPRPINLSAEAPLSPLKLPHSFRDRWFSVYFGKEIQDYLSTAGPEIEIDLSACEWIDPIPAMAMLCNLCLWANRHIDNNPKISVNLGEASTRSKDVSKSRARLYLASHGFLRSIANVCQSTTFQFQSSLDGYDREFRLSSIRRLEEAVSMTAGCNLLYGVDPGIPPTLLMSGKSAAEVASFVDDAIRSMDTKLFSGRQSEFMYRDSALVRVRQVATEVLLNASEHAYPVGPPGPICIYARLRQHGDHLADEDKESTSACPLVDHIHEVTSGKYIELFVCDVGVGLCHHSADWAASSSDKSLRKRIESAQRGNRKVKIGRLVSLVFREPVSRHKRDFGAGTRDRSNVTGLRHVNTVLTKQSDRSRLFVSPIWNSGRHPRPSTGYDHTSPEHFAPIFPEGSHPTGTYFHFALEVSHSALSLEGWLTPSSSQGNVPFCSLLREVFADSVTTSGTLPVFDLAAYLAQDDPSPELTLAQIAQAFEQKAQTSTSTLVIRMSRDFRKNLTDALVDRWLSICSNNETATTLAFCDLSRAQAILLSEHIQSLVPNGNTFGTRNPKRILIVSEDLISLTLQLRASERSRACFKPMGRHDLDMVAQVARALRETDSDAFWQRADNLDVPLLLKDVSWSTALDGGNASVLPIYLDYSLAVQHRELAKIVRRALRRALAAFPGHIALPIDELIRPDLADASRWMERSPIDSATPKCFVISSVVTGSTVTREARYRGIPSAVLACFIAPTNPSMPLDEQRFRYFSALRWTPKSVPQRSPSPYAWERIPGTPFVRPLKPDCESEQTKISLIRPVSRVIEDRGADEHRQPSVSESYHEWHRDQLLKIGHWNIERRHDLVEINHLNALQTSAVSGKGFYEWLANQLSERAKGAAFPMLVYPPGRLNAIMVRHLFKMRDLNGNRRLDDRWRAIPISYLPDIGDGLKQITQLAEQHIRETKGAIGGTVFFLDIGYVGNRTFRHTQRQLLALGVEKVVGFGLLNRTSAPALTESSTDNQIQCYWRLDVPSLDDQRSCPICSGLRAIDALWERTNRFQPMIRQQVEKIYEDWALADPGQQWEEHGLIPLRLPKPISKKFGFRIRPNEPVVNREQVAQRSLISDDGKPTLSDPEPRQTWWERDQVLNWNYIWLRDSAQATAYGIEIARTLCTPTYPLRLAREFAEEQDSGKDTFAGIAIAIEVLGSYLLLSSHEIPVAVKESAGVQLLRYLAMLESATSDFIAEVSADRLSRLRGLTSLALINLDGPTKRLLLDEILNLVTSTRFINDETRIALMTVLLESADEGSQTNDLNAPFKDRIRELLKSDHIKNSDAANIVRSNYWALTLSEHTLAEQFRHALRFFGAGIAHGDCMDRLKDAESWAGDQPIPSWALCRTTLQTALSMICRGASSSFAVQTSDVVPGELFNALCTISPEDLQMLRAMSTRNVGERTSTEVRNAIDLVVRIRESFQSSMTRFENTSPANGFSSMLSRIKTTVLRTAAERVNEVAIAVGHRKYCQAEGARYLLFGTELDVLLDRLVKDALRNAPTSRIDIPPWLQSAGISIQARANIILIGSSNGTILLSVWNCGRETSDEDAFIRQQDSLAIVHSTLGTQIRRRVKPDQNNRKWFCTEVQFSWVLGGKS